MPVGAGLAPAGVSPAGYGTPSTTTGPATNVLPDYVTGDTQTGRAIDPVNKTYTLTTDGRIQGVGTVQQLVQVALSTMFNSSAVVGLGLNVASVQEKGSDFQRQVATMVASALADLVRRKLVQIIDVRVDDLPAKPDGAWAVVLWRDLTTGQEQRTNL